MTELTVRFNCNNKTTKKREEWIRELNDFYFETEEINTHDYSEISDEDLAQVIYNKLSFLYECEVE